ncbi:MAG: ABC transporter transmembrane domain-containing protein [Rhodospirillaceae bacterium]|jgi:ABC-type multidrug transport system fused ATPase/permease subunit
MPPPISRSFKNSLPSSVFQYLWSEGPRTHVLLALLALSTMPFLYLSFEVPKQIINNAIHVSHFPIYVLGAGLSQLYALIALSVSFLAVVGIVSVLKYVVNVRKGTFGEMVLQRLRFLGYRECSKRSKKTHFGEVIPVLTHEMEAIGTFAGDAFVLPILQGGIFVTVVTFMFVQDVILGVAALALLPVQLWIIPPMQRKVNALTRDRAHEMRNFGGIVGSTGEVQNKTSTTTLLEQERKVSSSLEKIRTIRVELFRKKFLMKSLNNFIGHLTPFFFYLIGGFLVVLGDLTFGSLVGVLAAYKDLTPSLKELFKYYQRQQDVLIRYKGIREYLYDSSSENSRRTV